MVRLMQLKNKQFILTVPRMIIDSKKWRKGDVLIWGINDQGQVTIKVRD